jgi:hypothetical protein
MREFITAEYVCRDRDQNEIAVHEISVARNYGSRGQPDYRVQKDRYETADRQAVVSLDETAFQIIETGLILRGVRSAKSRLAA